MSLHEHVRTRTGPGLLTRSIATAGSIALLAGLLMAPAAQALPMETGTITEPAPAPVDPLVEDPAPADPAPAGEPSAEATPTETVPAEVPPAEVVPTETAPAAPENISMPVIEGDPVVGGTLTSTGGQWSGAGWIQYSWIIDGVAVQTAGHVVGEADVLNVVPSMAGKGVQLTVTASSGAQEAGTEASAVAVSVRPAAFTGVAWSNAVIGRPAVGQVLSLNPLTTQGTVAYQWFRGAVAITSATASRYTVTPGDVGQKLWAKVTLSASGYTSKELPSVQVTGVSGNFVTAPVPTVSGTARVGQVQTANPGVWAPTGAALSYQWYRGTAAIAGATGRTYTTSAADYGKALKVRVRATKAGFVTVDRYSAVRTIGAGTIVATKSLLVTGVHRFGQTLRISQGWTPGVTLRYQWYRNGVAIRGGTGSSLYLNRGFIGSRVNVKVTVSKAGYATRAASTKLVTVGKAVITPRTAPKITGGQWLGATLTANPGTFSPASSAYGYQWYRNGVAISGARYKTYRIAAADNGKSLSVRVWASKTYYDTRAVGSPAVKLPTWAVTVLRGDGTYRVGTQIRPGLYKATGGSFGYWARLKGFSGGFGDINENDIVSGVTYVQILPGDVGFKTSGCGAWTTVPSTGARATRITKDGTYRVGIDILPGTYYGYAAGDFCMWTTLRGFSGGYTDVDEWDVPSGAIIVTIPAGVKGFEVDGCGTLTRR